MDKKYVSILQRLGSIEYIKKTNNVDYLIPFYEEVVSLKAEPFETVKIKLVMSQLDKLIELGIDIAYEMARIIPGEFINATFPRLEHYIKNSIIGTFEQKDIDVKQGSILVKTSAPSNLDIYKHTISPDFHVVAQDFKLLGAYKENGVFKLSSEVFENNYYIEDVAFYYNLVQIRVLEETEDFVKFGYDFSVKTDFDSVKALNLKLDSGIITSLY